MIPNQTDFQPPAHTFQIPKAVRSEIARPNLIELLERDSDVKVIALVAPAGYGKTTVLAQYARATSLVVAWLTLEADAIDALHVAKGIAFALRRALSSEDAEPPQTLNAIKDEILDLLGNANKNVRIILDHAEHLGVESSTWLERLVNQLPEGHRIITSGYEFSLPGLARLIARGEADIIELKQLAFTVVESTSYLEARGFSGDTEQTHNALEGWPAGIGLISANLVSQIDSDDLIGEVFNALPEMLRSCLPEAAALEIWDETAANSYRIKLPEHWLEAVRKSGLPMTPLGNHQYRPHSVLRKILLKELAKRPERFAILLRQAAVEAEMRGDVVRAISDYRVSGSLPDALRLAQQMVTMYEERFELSMSRQVLEQFKVEQLSVELTASLGWAWAEGGDLEQAEGLLVPLHVLHPDHPWVCYCLSTVRVIQSQIHELIVLVDHGLSLNPIEPWRGRLLRMKGSILLSLEQLEEARRITSLGIDEMERAADLVNLAKNLALFADICLSNDSLDEAEPPLIRAIEIFEYFDIPIRATIAYRQLASVFFKQGKWNESFAAIEKAEAILSREVNKKALSQKMYLYDFKGDLFFYTQTYSSALDSYNKSLRAARSLGHGYCEAMALFQIYDAHVNNNELQQAHEALEAANRIPHKQGPQVEPAHLFFNGLASFRNGMFAQANELFNRYLKFASTPLRKFRTRLYLAEIARIQGMLTKDMFETILANAQGIVLENIIRVDQRELASLYREFSQQGWYLGGNQAIENLAIGTNFTDKKAILEIQTFGKGSAKVNGVSIKFPFSKTIEILIWLAMNGPASREFVVDAVWDGSREQKDAEYARVSLRKLRVALSEINNDGFNPLPYFEGQYRLSSEFQIRLDCTRFESLALSQNTNDLKEALALMTQPFLYGVNSEWVEAYRTKLNEQALLTALKLGKLIAVTEPRQKIAAYRRAIEIDPLCEDAHIALIETHQKAGEDLAAKIAYRNYAQMLMDEFGFEPDPDIQKRLNILK
jgi:LuxR family transcriptional regulator, maltose regulon positive regulatory protein